MRAKQEREGAWWVFVEGSETGIPMSEVIVVEKAQAAPSQPKASPSLPLEAVARISASTSATLSTVEREWLRGPLSREVNYRLIVSGDVGPKEIGKLIKLLEAQKAVLDDDDLSDLA